MKTYKFRAECMDDVEQLVALLQPDDIVDCTPHPRFPDVEVEIATKKAIEELMGLIRKITDGHVMLQTLELKEDYTGNRCYSRR